MSENSKYWYSIIYTENKQQSIEILKRVEFLPLKDIKSEAYYGNNGVDLILAKLTQYYLADELFDKKKMQQKLDLLFANKELNSNEKFILWTKLESKMFNIIINYTKKYFSDSSFNSLIIKEKFYTNMFEILSKIINEDFLNAVLQHRYFMGIKQSNFIETEIAIEDFVKSILGEFVWFKEINDINGIKRIILDNNEYVKFSEYYQYNNNIAEIKEEEKLSEFIEKIKNNSDYEKYLPPKFIIALEEYDDMSRKNFLKIITLNIKKLLEEQKEIYETLKNIIGSVDIEEDNITQEQLNKIIEENKKMK